MSSITLDTENWNVYLTSSAFLTMIGSIVENYQKETGGILVGSYSHEWIEGKSQPAIKIHSSFPSITAKVTGSSWLPNEAAYNRTKGFAKSYDLEILGEYHSHPKGEPELSKGDVEYIESRYKHNMALASDYLVDEEKQFLTWLEIVASITKKNYSTNYEPNAQFKTISDGYKLKGTIKTGGKQGFEISAMAWGYFVYRPDEDEEEEEDEGEFYILPIYTEIYP